MAKIVFAAISPHPPLILPSVGSEKDRLLVSKTIKSLEFLGKEFEKNRPDLIIISSPHADWGFNVPLYFLAKDFKGRVEEFLTGMESPKFYFEEGKKIYESEIKKSKLKIALVASGDLSHYLKEDGPYGFEPEGPEFDKALILGLKRKKIKSILDLDDDYPAAGECGLRSFCFMLGIIEAANINWEAKILSYEGPFGVGYLVANLKVI